MKFFTKQQKRFRRHVRSRSRMQGTASVPRMCAYRSLTGMYIQLVDDTANKTLSSVNTKKDFDKSIDVKGRTGKVAVAYALGYKIAQKAKEQGIQKAVFDRSGFAYHGRIAAAADGARDGGLQI